MTKFELLNQILAQAKKYVDVFENDLLEQHAEELGIEFEDDDWLEIRDFQHDVCQLQIENGILIHD